MKAADEDKINAITRKIEKYEKYMDQYAG